MEKQADLRKWFKEKWVDISRKNPDGSHPECGRDEAKLGRKGYPKCRPKAKAAQMTKKEKSYAVRAKRSKRQGVGGKPTMVPTEKPDRKSMKKEASILEKLAFSESTRDAKNTLTSAQLDKEDPEFAVSGVSKKNALRGMGHNLSREDMATVKNTDASPKYMDAGGTSNRARLKTWRKTMKGNKKNFFARRRVLKQVKSNTDEPSIIAIKKDGTRHLVAGNSRASLRSALGMPIKAHVFHDVEQTKTAMNLFDHFQNGLEKVAAQSGLNMTFDGLPRDIRKSIALNHAAMVANDHGTAADYHEAMGRRATKQNKTSVKKSEKPGVLSTIRHLGRQNAKTYHKGRAKSTAADMKLHSREFGKADKHANEHFNVLKSIVESNDRPKDQDRIISDYNKKHMKAKVRVSGSLMR